MKKTSKILELVLFIGIIAVFIGAVIHIAWRWFNDSVNAFSGLPLEAMLLIEAAMCILLEIVLIVVHLIMKRRIRKAGEVPYSARIVAPVKRRPIRTLVILIIVLFVIFLCLFSKIESRLLYQTSGSTAEYEYYLSNHDNFEEVVIKGDSCDYRGWIHKGGSNKTVIYFGGNAQSSACTLKDYDMEEQWGTFGDYNFLMIDYPGYGSSDGEPGKEALLDMADEVIEYVSSRKSLNEDTVIMGYSLGTGIATYAASQNEAGKLILLAPYDEMINVYNSMVNIFHFPLKYLVKNNYQSDLYAETVNSDVLIIASEDDEIIPYELSENLAECFKKKVDFKTIEGISHNEVPSDSNTMKYVSEVLN